MKTVMQEFIEALDIEMKQKGIIPNWDMYLEKEKEQIIDAADKARNTFGDEFDFSYEFTDGEEYYNQTYNQTK